MIMTRKTALTFLFLMAICCLLEATEPEFQPISEAQSIKTATNEEKIIVLITGETAANLEQCGCVSQPAGGLARRAAIVKELRNQYPVILLDCGDIFDGKEEEDKIRIKAYLKGMELLKYDAVGLGKSELTLGNDFFLSALSDSKLPFLSANWRFADSDVKLWKPSIIKKVGKRKVAIIGVSQETSGVTSDGMTLIGDNISDSAAPIVARWRSMADLTIVLSSLDGTQDSRLSTVLDGVDIIATGHSGPLYEKMNNVIVVHSIHLGKGLIKIEVSFSNNPDLRPTYKIDLVYLDPEKPEDAEMRGVLSKFYLEAESIPGYKSAKTKLFENMKEENRPNDGYIGEKACRPCHNDKFISWQKTKHKYAFRTLAQKNRFFLPKCQICHVTGFGYETGFSLSKNRFELSDTQCETCHGPGKLHSEKGQPGMMRIVTDKAICMQCHDKENDPEFEQNFEEKLGKIAH